MTTQRKKQNDKQTPPPLTKPVMDVVQAKPVHHSKEDRTLYEEVAIEEALGFESLGDGADDAVRLDESTGLVHHRDLSDIEVTEIDGITINRTKRKVSPFVPIVKTPTYSENSGNHTGYAVEIEDQDSDTGLSTSAT